MTRWMLWKALTPLALCAAALCLLAWPAFAQSGAREVELTQARRDGLLDFYLAGTGGSGSMTLTVVSKTETLLSVEVEVGTKLEPEGGDVQKMVVTREVHVKVHAHQHQTVELEVSCLDISKAPPSASDTRWSVSRSSSLASFLGCVDGVVDELKREDPDHAREFEGMRPLLKQFGLWQARGASHGDWIEFWVKYQHKSREEAEQLVGALTPLLNEIVNHCPSLGPQ